MAVTVRAVLAVCLALMVLGAPAPGLARQPATPTPPEGELTPPEQRIENVIAAASVYLGVPYRLGAEGPDFMDCSGLIYRAFTDAGEARRMSGARLGVRSYVRWFAARGALVLDAADAVRGDLAIWGAGQHMGLYLGDGRVISAVTSGVTVHALLGIGLPLTGFLRPDWSGNGRVEPLDPSLLLDQSETPVALVPASAWAPALDPSIDGAQPVRAGEERVEMRTASSRTFDNGDGTFTTELHPQPIYYQAPDSADWVPIDLGFTSLEADGDQPAGAAVTASPVVINAFPSDAADGFLTLAAGERKVSIGRIGDPNDEPAAPVIGIDGRTVDYLDFFGDGASLRTSAQPDGMRSFVVMRDEPERSYFSFRLAGDDLMATMEIDGSITLRDAAAGAVGRITRPQLIDSSDISGDGGGIFTAATSLSVDTAADGALVVTIGVEQRYLDEAVYPAFVDFSITDFPAASPGADVAVISGGHPNSVFAGAERPEQPFYGESWLGRQPGTRNDNELYLRFDDPRLVIGGADIQGVALELYPYWGNDGGATFAVRGVTADWKTAALSWLSRPPAEMDLGSVSFEPGEWARVDLAETPEYGVVLAAAQPGPDTWTRLIARDQSDEIGFGPRLVVTWSGLRPTLGSAPESAALAPVVAWTNAPVASEQHGFEVQVSADDFATTVAESGIVRGQAGSVTTWILPTDRLAYGDYAARVRTNSDETGWSEWSDDFDFLYGPVSITPTWSALMRVHGDD